MDVEVEAGSRGAVMWLVQATGEGGRSWGLWVPPADPDPELWPRPVPPRGGPEPTWAAPRKPAGAAGVGPPSGAEGARAAGWPPSKQMSAGWSRWIHFPTVRGIRRAPARGGVPAEPSEGRRRAGLGAAERPRVAGFGRANSRPGLWAERGLALYRDPGTLKGSC